MGIEFENLKKIIFQPTHTGKTSQARGNKKAKNIFKVGLMWNSINISLLQPCCDIFFYGWLVHTFFKLYGSLVFEKT